MVYLHTCTWFLWKNLVGKFSSQSHGSIRHGFRSSLQSHLRGPRLDITCARAWACNCCCCWCCLSWASEFFQGGEGKTPRKTQWWRPWRRPSKKMGFSWWLLRPLKWRWWWLIVPDHKALCCFLGGKRGIGGCGGSFRFPWSIEKQKSVPARARMENSCPCLLVGNPGNQLKTNYIKGGSIIPGWWLNQPTRKTC